MALEFLKTNEVTLKPAAFVGILIILIIIGYAFGIFLAPKETPASASGGNGTQTAVDCSSCQPVEPQKKSLSFDEGLIEIKNSIIPYNSLDELIQNSTPSQDELFANNLLKLKASLDNSAPDSAAIKDAADAYTAILNALKVENDLIQLKAQVEGYDLCKQYTEYIAGIKEFKTKSGQIKSDTLPAVSSAIAAFNSKYPAKVALVGLNETITLQVENKINALSDSSGFVTDETEIANLNKSFCGG